MQSSPPWSRTASEKHSLLHRHSRRSPAAAQSGGKGKFRTHERPATPQNQYKKCAAASRHRLGGSDITAHFCISASLCALDLTRTQAARADVHALMRAVHDCFDPTDVGLPGSVGLTVGVGYVVTEYHAFSANITLCHLKYLLNHSHPERRRSYITSLDFKSRSLF